MLALFLGVPLAYWTYTIVNGGFRWYALFPGVVGGLFLLVAVSMAIQGEEVAGDGEDAGGCRRFGAGRRSPRVKSPLGAHVAHEGVKNASKLRDSSIERSAMSARRVSALQGPPGNWSTAL
ncbi:MAG: hypothetical protein H0U51_10480 [Propionibacteriales bacterium]|nr:hypothetical protein [Propionibacteriales bacterium]